MRMYSISHNVFGRLFEMSWKKENQKMHWMSRRIACGCLSVWAFLSMLWTGIPSATADQFVLFDATFTFTKEDADNSKPSPSHYYVRDKLMNEERPRNWTTPVDYRNGTAHIRLEVLEKPAGGEATTWSVCYIPNKGRDKGYGCFNTPVYEQAGVYEKDIDMTKFWQHDSIVWEEGIKEMHLVIKDNSGGSGHAHKRKDHEKFFPTKVRMTVVQVSAGSKYDASLVPDLSSVDAGESSQEKKENRTQPAVTSKQ